MTTPIQSLDRAIQEVLDRVIDSGYYTEESNALQSSFMCGALHDASRAGVISEVERVVVQNEIKKWLSHGSSSGMLQSTLLELGLPSSFYDRVAIYRDWANRPELILKRYNKLTRRYEQVEITYLQSM